MDRHTFTVAPFLVAFLIGLTRMAPTEVYQICRQGIGFLKVAPWRKRASDAIGGVARASLAWLTPLWRWRVACAGAVLVLLLLLTSDVTASGVLFAVVPVARPGRSLTALQKKRKGVLDKAEALKQADGTFANDQVRAAFDGHMAEIEQLDIQIRALATPDQDDEDADPADATAAERQRGLDIRAAVRAANLDEAVATDLITRSIGIDEARGIILAQLAERQGPPTNGINVTMPGEDARDKWVRGAANWLLVRSGMAGLVAQHLKVEPSSLDPGEFRGASLLDLGREYLHRNNVKTRGLDRMELAGLALSYRANYQSTSDFATLLENTLHKVLRAAYAITPDTWSRWCGTASVTDFRTNNWYRLGSLTQLDDLTENGEFKNKAIPDAEKSTYSVATKGNIIAITRQVIVNDDLGAITRLTDMMGRAGKLTIEKACYALLGLNSGLGPTQSDSQALFHSNRSNVGTASTIGMAALDADATVMAAQTDPNGQDILELQPAVLLVPRTLLGTARGIIGAEYDPDTTGKLQKPNIVRNMVADIVGTARLTGTRRYLFANPTLYPVFLVSFLEGMREPVLETQDGFRVDGVEMKARLDFGVDAVDYRGAVTNAGTP